ncbi:GlxA family transcriptional regulator [Agrobacterium tumefaciens]|uniref:GlxA family transcriptional regulator n=1 Tax=Agrobacterium tumefaciens TaxID=358 RepID=UPI0021CED9D6|nr:DJ-1/PfpI family protein [Agrobacterium tumefaciens]UXS05399.1 helix-turn-helix domain-containing protein [Agrobacterium tumefaciens]
MAFTTYSTALDLAGPMDVFAAANALLAPQDGYRLLYVSPQHGPVRLCNGSRILPDLSCAEANGDYDVVLVAGGPIYTQDPALCTWLADACRRARLFGSICTGAFALGDAGLLDGHTVTTHWEFAQKLAAWFPTTIVDADRIFIRSGPLITSAGVTAGIDLALALVAEDHGAKLSLRIAQQLVVLDQRQGGQSQYSPYLSAAQDANMPISRVQAYVNENVGENYNLERLAAIAGMSVRSFSRHFTLITKITPREFIERARVDCALRLLEGTGSPLKTIAHNCGFGSADNMCRVFKRRLRVSPRDYRERFNREL